MSPRSFARPVARLLRMKSSRPRKSTVRLPKRPGSRERHASEMEPGQFRQHIDADWRHADLEHEAGPGEISRRDVAQRGAKRLQRAHHPRGVLRFGFYPHVEGAGGPGAAVVRQCVGAHDEEPDVSADERAQQIDKVRVHRHCAPPTPTVRPTGATPAAPAPPAATDASTPGRAARPRRWTRSAARSRRDGNARSWAAV